MDKPEIPYRLNMLRTLRQSPRTLNAAIRAATEEIGSMMGVQEKEFLNIFGAIISEDSIWLEHFLGVIRWITVTRGFLFGSETAIQRGSNEPFSVETSTQCWA